MSTRVIEAAEIETMDKRFRANLINSVSGFKSANLLGSINKHGKTNLAIFNSVVHIGSNPPLLGFILRPTSVPRHSFENILETGYYTLNHVNDKIVEPAHQTSAKYPEGQSEFMATGLTEELLDGFPAPFVSESQIKIGLRFMEEIPIKINATRLVIGQIEMLILNEKYLAEDGSLDLMRAGSLAINGLDHYHQAVDLKKLPYARP
jgi:flavin reductase (DIM6/NTAB) family NADH-FMN oxidoreductase RutF